MKKPLLQLLTVPLMFMVPQPLFAQESEAPPASTDPLTEPSAEPSPAPSPAPTPQASEPDDEFCLELSCAEEFPFDLNLLFNLGYNRYGLETLNTAMRDKGYSNFGENMLSLGGSLQFITWNVLTEFEGNVGLTTPSFNSDYQVNLTTGNFLLNLGYQFKPLRELSIYPLLGIGVGFLDMDFRSRKLFPSFDEFLSNPGRQSRLGNVFLTLNLGLGIDWRWGWGFQAGLRGGWLWTPPSNWWGMSNVYSNSDGSSNSVNLAGGPEITLGGPYLKLMLGF